MDDVEKRRWVRHPIQVPLAVRPKGGAPGFRTRAGDLSEGGVSLTSQAPIAVGSLVEVDIPVRQTLFTLTGTVVACLERRDGGFRIGLAFTGANESFRLKLAEQVLRIEELRLQLSRERGVEVSSNEASLVWVERYAQEFGKLFSQS